MTIVKVDVWGADVPEVCILDAKRIHVPSGLYEILEVTPLHCTIGQLPAVDGCLSFRFWQQAPERWYVGGIVECFPNPESRTGRTIQLRDSESRTETK